MAEQKNLCYNCFQEREAPEGPCPYCGFDLAENEKKFPVALRAGTILNGRYIIGRVLGQGGFGITYLAWDTKLEARVAVKEFMPNEIATRVGTTVSVAVESRSEDFTYGAERFQEEARTLAKFMGQPNIAGVTDYFDENDTSYFVMDYIEGISFKTYIANHGGKVSVEEALNVMIPVLRALTAVHAEGFIHRDVTPDNIYITKDGMVKLLDFGSARYSIGDKSKSLDVILKVGYAPKEQYIRRSRQGPFTDVYSCAACFYAAITGFLPPEALERLEHDDLVPVSQCGIDIPEYLDKAILKGLAVQPEDRFQSAAEFLDAIESQQVVEVPVSGGAAAPTPEKKKVKPALIAAIAAAVVVAVGIGIAIGGGSDSGSGGGNPIAEALAPTVTIGGEEYSTALEELDLSGKGLTDADLLPLAEMTNLTSLTLSKNEIADISPLAGLTNLTSLNLRDTNISDLSSLAGLTELSYLNISGGNIQDLSPLRNLIKLQELNLSSNEPSNFDLNDLSPLSDMKDMQRLNIDVGTVTDLSPLAGMTELTSLQISGTMNITSLEPLGQLTKLRILGFYNSSSNSVGHVEDFSPLGSLTQLEQLVVNLDGISDLGFVENMNNLTRLELYGVGTVQDLSPLANLTNLNTLMLPATLFQSGAPLSIECFSGLTDLYILRLGGNVIDLGPLSNLTNLKSLDLGGGGGQFSNLEPLGALTQLTDLTIQDNGGYITDLTPLKKLTQLQTLTIRNNNGNIIDLSPVSHVPNVDIS